MNTDNAHPTLRRSLTTPKIVFLVVAAAAPLAAMVGTVPLAFSIGNGAGVPGVFLLAGLTLLCFSVGYAAMSRHVVNAGGFYTYLSYGLGKPVAVGGGLVAVLAYNTICIGLAGTFGYFCHIGFAQNGVNIPWQVWTALGLGLVAYLGYRQIDISARVLRWLMLTEVGVLVVFDLGVIGHKGAAALPATSLSPHTMFTGAVGVTMMFAFASFIGFESAALYAEEAHNPKRSVPLATYTSVILIAGFYAFTSWVAVGAVGADRLHAVAKDQLGDLFFNLADRYASNAVDQVMQVLVLTSLFAAMLALHNATNRYMFALGRERVLPRWLGHVHSKRLSPSRASVVQSVISTVVVGGFAVAGLDPYTNLATSMIGLGTLGIVVLQAGAAIAVVGFFRNRPDRQWWRTILSPGLGAVGLIAASFLLSRNFAVLCGTHSALVAQLPWLVFAVAAFGIGYASWLRRSDPARYAAIASTVTPEVAESLELAGSSVIP